MAPLYEIERKSIRLGGGHSINLTLWGQIFYIK